MTVSSLCGAGCGSKVLVNESNSSIFSSKEFLPIDMRLIEVRLSETPASVMAGD